MKQFKIFICTTLLYGVVLAVLNYLCSPLFGSERDILGSCFQGLVFGIIMALLKLYERKHWK